MLKMLDREGLSVLDRVRGLGYAIEWIVGIVIAAVTDPSFYKVRTSEDDKRIELAKTIPELFKPGNLAQIERLIDLIDSRK